MEEDNESATPVYHKEIKQRDFKDVNSAWKDVQLLLYTGTLSCGVDFSPEDFNDNFDTFVNVFQKNCGLPTQFIQSFMRCRTFKDKEHHLLIEQHKSCAPVITVPSRLWDEKNDSGLQLKYKLNDQNEGLKVYLDTRMNQLKTYSSEYIISALNDMGFTMTI